MEKQITKTIAWLEKEIARIEYGEIIIKIIRHNGTTVRVEQTQTEKIQVKS